MHLSSCYLRERNAGFDQPRLLVKSLIPEELNQFHTRAITIKQIRKKRALMDCQVSEVKPRLKLPSQVSGSIASKTALSILIAIDCKRGSRNYVPGMEFPVLFNRSPKFRCINGRRDSISSGRDAKEELAARYDSDTVRRETQRVVGRFSSQTRERGVSRTRCRIYLDFPAQPLCAARMSEKYIPRIPITRHHPLPRLPSLAVPSVVNKIESTSSAVVRRRRKRIG